MTDSSVQMRDCFVATLLAMTKEELAMTKEELAMTFPICHCERSEAIPFYTRCLIYKWHESAQGDRT